MGLQSVIKIRGKTSKNFAPHASPFQRFTPGWIIVVLRIVFLKNFGGFSKDSNLRFRGSAHGSAVPRMVPRFRGSAPARAMRFNATVFLFIYNYVTILLYTV